MAKSELHRDYILELENELQEFEKKADSSTKRLQILVYPAMIAFVILSAFGFYLIYSLTSDVNRMADTIIHMSGSIDTNMNSISGTMVHISTKMDSLNDSTRTMSGNLGNMTDNTVEMVKSIGGMRSATYDMAASTNNMQRDMWSLNKNISTPLSAMNKFLPWKDSTSMPFPGSKAPLPQSYFAYPAQHPPYMGNNAGSAGGLIPAPRAPVVDMDQLMISPPGSSLSPAIDSDGSINQTERSSAIYSQLVEPQNIVSVD